MSMSKKDIIETLKAMEIDYDGRASAESLQELLDEAMGTSKKEVKKEEKPKVEFKKEDTKKDQPKRFQNPPSFAELMAYDREMRKKAKGK